MRNGEIALKAYCDLITRVKNLAKILEICTESQFRYIDINEKENTFTIWYKIDNEWKHDNLELFVIGLNDNELKELKNSRDYNDLERRYKRILRLQNSRGCYDYQVIELLTDLWNNIQIPTKRWVIAEM